MTTNAINTITCGNVVYVQTLKCASTFFWQNFKRFGWWEIRFDSIDWKNQRVFSHILDPDQRRHKGVAEYIDMNDAYDLFYENETFKKFIAHIPTLDQHSVSYHDQYGDYCNLIDWIPLSGHSNQAVVKKTEMFLIHHSARMLDKWEYLWEHSSSDFQKLLVKDLEDCWNKDQPAWIQWYLQRDRILYNRVVERFNYSADTWPKSSWLEN